MFKILNNDISHILYRPYLTILQGPRTPLNLFSASYRHFLCLFICLTGLIDRKIVFIVIYNTSVLPVPIKGGWTVRSVTQHRHKFRCAFLTPSTQGRGRQWWIVFSHEPLHSERLPFKMSVPLGSVPNWRFSSPAPSWKTWLGEIGFNQVERCAPLILRKWTLGDIDFRSARRAAIENFTLLIYPKNHKSLICGGSVKVVSECKRSPSRARSRAETYLDNAH